MAITPITAQPRKLSIFYVNDLHGDTDCLGGLYAASKRFDETRLQQDVLKISAGDNVAGGDTKKNSMIISILSGLGIKLSAVGNHEFDASSENFAKLLQKSDIQYVSSNLAIEGSSPLKPLVKDCVVREINGEKYGILGATTDELEQVVRSKQALKGVETEDFEKTVSELQKRIDELRKSGVNKIILVSHSGLEVDRKIAQALSGLDIIISGHSHDLVEGIKEGENLFADKDGNPVVIAQVGENGRNYGILDVEFTQDGIIKRVGNDVHKTHKLESFTDSFMDRIFGKSPTVAIIGSIEPFPKNKRKSPCAWSNLICDAMKSELKGDIAIINSAGVRKVPKKGKLTERNIFDTTPMKNKLRKTTFSEKEIVEIIKFGAKSFLTEDGYPGLIQVSGLTYTIDTSGNLLDLNFVDDNGQKTKININNPREDKEYTVILDNFLGNGKEYPPCDISKKQVKAYDFDKDKTLVNYLARMPLSMKQNLIIQDDGRVKII